VSFVLLELAYVLFAIWPDQMTVPMHFIIQPVSFVFLVIRPEIDTLTLDFIHVELSLVN